MKVLRRGPEPEPVDYRRYRCECKHCKSELEYDWTDLFRGDMSNHWMIRCPVCGKGIFQNFIQRWRNRVRICPPLQPW